MAAAPIFPPDRVTIVGVLNLTPDSFSDGGRLLRGDGGPDLDAVLAAARGLLAAGAHAPAGSPRRSRSRAPAP
jgi:dihydropteroate synthase